jgi:hypothetical protein
MSVSTSVAILLHFPTTTVPRCRHLVVWLLPHSPPRSTTPSSAPTTTSLAPCGTKLSSIADAWQRYEALVNGGRTAASRKSHRRRTHGSGTKFSSTADARKGHKALVDGDEWRWREALVDSARSMTASRPHYTSERANRLLIQLSSYYANSAIC